MNFIGNTKVTRAFSKTKYSEVNNVDTLKSSSNAIVLKSQTDKDDSLKVIETLTSKTVNSFEEFDEQDNVLEVKLYGRRWLMLLMFMSFTIGNKAQWVQYTIILNVVTKYFGVSTLAIKSTAMVYNICFFVFLYPIMRMIDKWGLRIVCIIATALMCLGTWIKYFAISPDGFILTMVGQCLVASFQVVVVVVPATLAAYWFGPNEIATATAIGTSGLSFGITIFSLIAPIIVKMHDDLDDIGSDLKNLNLPWAIYCTCVFVFVLTLFQKEPNLPPSKARALQIINKNKKFSFRATLFRLLKNKNYLLLWNSAGIIIAQVLSINASLNALYMAHFKNGVEVGRVSLIYRVGGFAGSLIFGRIVDKTKKFKLMLVIAGSFYVLSDILFALSFYLEMKWAVFTSAGLLGFFGLSYYIVSLEICAEITYPESGNFCITILVLADQIYALIILACSDKLILVYNDLAAHIFFIVIAAIGLILTLFVKDEHKRQNAAKINSSIRTNKL